MNKYVENIEENHGCDIEIEKEKIEKYAKYIGYNKKEIYCARVEALYIYKTHNKKRPLKVSMIIY
ncbi:hypothetical protein QJS64_10620 [Paraclostridium bifermentans]|uniref:Uncharacterized protein n=1 Tax=Paraclostridium bifermentans TaxID=1490 RepID=A0ABY8QZC7_PARBF|nr:hypothetical protein QJS64_10620 [Paraclostridium bifermentans]